MTSLRGRNWSPDSIRQFQGSSQPSRDAEGRGWWEGGFGESGPSRGGLQGVQEVGTGAIPQCLRAPHCGFFSLPHPPLFFMSFFITPFTRQGHTKIQSFIHSLNISVRYKWGDRNAFHLFIQHTLKIISLCKTARCNQLLSYVTGEKCISSGYS